MDKEMLPHVILARKPLPAARKVTLKGARSDVYLGMARSVSRRAKRLAAVVQMLEPARVTAWDT